MPSYTKSMSEGFLKRSLRLYAESLPGRSLWRESWTWAVWMTLLNCGAALLRGRDVPFSTFLSVLGMTYFVALAVFGVARVIALKTLRSQPVRLTL